MTYGEEWFARKQAVLKNPKLDCETLTDKTLPPRMSREEAGRYYNTKLFAYWMDRLDDNLSIYRKKQIISLFMFGHIDRYKLFKDEK